MPKRKSGFQVAYDFSAVMWYSESAGKYIAITTMHYFHILNAMRKVKQDSPTFIEACIAYLQTVKVERKDRAEFKRRLSEFTG